MPYTTYNCDALQGGAARALDSYGVATLTTGDRAIVALSGTVYYFVYDSTATAAETVAAHPYVIRPDDYSTEGNWEEYEPVGGGDVVDDTSPQLGGLLDTNAFAIDESYATVASHATTSAIWAALGNVINFTGTETITDFPAANRAGAQRFLICAAACVFTHAGNITVQGGATYTAVAGDVAIVTAITTTTFKVNILKNIIAATSGANSDITSLTALSGQQTIPTINLTGGQIAFPATAVPSADPNTLDDYEEGYVTSITLTCGTSGTITVDSTLDTLAYTKIGRVVHIQGSISVSAVSSPVGTLVLGDLPFTVADLTEGAEACVFEVSYLSISAVVLGIVGLPLANGTTLSLRERTTTGFTNDLADNIIVSSYLYFNFNYIA